MLVNPRFISFLMPIVAGGVLLWYKKRTFFEKEEKEGNGGERGGGEPGGGGGVKEEGGGGGDKKRPEMEAGTEKDEDNNNLVVNNNNDDDNDDADTHQFSVADKKLSFLRKQVIYEPIYEYKRLTMESSHMGNADWKNENRFSSRRLSITSANSSVLLSTIT